MFVHGINKSTFVLYYISFDPYTEYWLGISTYNVLSQIGNLVLESFKIGYTRNLLNLP